MALSKQQQRVVRAMSHGHSRDQTGQLLGLSPHTVKQHLQLARRSNQARNTTHLVAMALREGWIT